MAAQIQWSRLNSVITLAFVLLLAGSAVAQTERPTQRAEFKIRAPDAHIVCLAGDFNAWDTQSAPMARDGDGAYWRASLNLPMGIHRYRFYVDGKERFPKNQEVEYAAQGFKANVLIHQWPTGEELMQYDLKLKAPYAGRVHVAGEFNGWNTSSMEMSDTNGDGVYEATLRLKPGVYLYKFIVDGVEWIPDPHSEDYIMGDGIGNSVLIADRPHKTNRTKLGDTAAMSNLTTAVQFMYAVQQGFAYSVLGLYGAAQKSFEAAHAASRQLNKFCEGLALDKLARIEYEMGNNYKAEKLFRQSIFAYPAARNPYLGVAYVAATAERNLRLSGSNYFTLKLAESWLYASLQHPQEYGRESTRDVDRDTPPAERMKRYLKSIPNLREALPPDVSHYPSLEQLFVLGWIHHRLGRTASADACFEKACQAAEGSKAIWLPPAAHFYAGMLARDMGDFESARAHFDAVLAANPNHEYAQLYRQRPREAPTHPVASDAPGFFLESIRLIGRRWEHLGQEEALAEILRERIEGSGVVRWIDAGEFGRYTVDRGVPTYRALRSQKFMTEFARDRRVAWRGHLVLVHMGKSIQCKLYFGKGGSIGSDFDTPLVFRVQGQTRLSDMADIVRDQVLARTPVLTKILSVEPDGVYIKMGANQGLRGNERFEVADTREIADSATGETYLIHARGLARLKIVEVYPEISKAQIEHLRPGSTLQAGMTAARSARAEDKPLDAAEAEQQSGKLRIKSIRIPEIFPAGLLHYAEFPLVRIAVENPGSLSLSNLRVRFEIPDLMDLPSEKVVDRVMPEASMIIDLSAAFSRKILDIQGEEMRQAKIIFSWEFGGKTLTDERLVPVKVMGRNALTWVEPEMIGAFVGATDPAFVEMTRRILAAADTSFPFLDRNLAGAIVLFEAFRNVRYAKDPRAPYIGRKEDRVAVDFIQFPAETLERGFGDCDDMAVLYASALESLGIPARFVLVPGHIFVAFMTDISARSWDLLGLPKSQVLVLGDRVWLAVETTMLGGGFLRAVERGAQQIRRESSTMFSVSAAWEKYKPIRTGFPHPIIDNRAAWNGYRAAENELRRMQDEYIQRTFHTPLRINPNDTELIKALGHFLWRIQRYVEAEGIWKQAALRTPKDGEVEFYLGIAAYRRGSIDDAERHFQESVKLIPNDHRPWLNLALLLESVGRNDESLAAYQRAYELNPEVESKFGRMFGTTEQLRSLEETETWRWMVFTTPEPVPSADTD